MNERPRAAPHVTLVLGAGGPVGQAFHAGVLHALAEACGWDARGADVIVGTSAGAQVGALLRAGWNTHRLLQRATRPPPAPAPPRKRARWPASRAYLRAIVARPWRVRLGPLVAALLPEGAHDAAHLHHLFDELFAGHWPKRPLWIPAVHADSGARVVFGRADAPRVDLATAVRSSSAVPGLRRPVAVGPDRYVDGGVASATHADLALDATAEPAHRRTVVVLSPLSRFWPLRLALRWELWPIARRGIDVILFEPDRAVARAMGWNPMSRARVDAVADAAYHATRRRLQRADAAALVRQLVGA
ncbi:MAG TPA: patatin-like phospholipase family protein [Polyangia bacterium]